VSRHDCFGAICIVTYCLPTFVPLPVLPCLYCPACTALPAVGVQVRPDLAVHDINGSLNAAVGATAGRPSSIDDVSTWLRGVTSVALSYSPEARTRAGEC
jgi:hypothetical protein